MAARDAAPAAVFRQGRASAVGWACLLRLHRETDCYPELEVVLVYPSTYVARGREVRDGGVVVEGGA
ncbi:zinc-dependent peptidase [Sorangium sp. So ce1097]|uniref:zinc-dependent peptidase n=1 Tax=Sorangium sp. So ce1097 TaxID=3133330 RepID=UPI003F624ED2